MALLDSEIRVVRMELGYNALGVQAEPYIGVVAIFNTVIQQYITAGAATTCSTTVLASAAGATSVTLTLASVAGFTPNDRVYVDVDSRQEEAVVQAVNGSTITCLLALAHDGTYPVTVDGGEAMVRDLIRQLRLLAGPGGRIERAAGRAGLKRVDDVEFFGGGSGKGSGGKSPLEQLIMQREYLRDELANALGVERLNRRGGSGRSVEAY